jgi:hypothetical protein
MRILTVVLCLFISLIAASQTPERREYSAKKNIESDIKVDGKLDEPEWQSANWENRFIQFSPHEGENPGQQTEFAILYNKNNIYVAIKAFDKNPEMISTRLTRRDEAEGDGVGIIFDTYHDKRTGFSFGVSAAGIKSDMVLSDDAAIQDKTWDPIWYVKTAITDEGWNAEMCIPLDQLRFKEGDSQIWGMQVNRYIFRLDEASQWQPMKRDEAGYISKFGELTGIDSIKPKNILEFTPYVVTRFERFKKVPENPFRSSGKINEFDAGLDAKIGLTNFITMDLTVNPDFGQVEADPSRVNLSAHETFFEEKRPFFVEGKNILKYNLQVGDNEWTTEGLFYSRRIGRKPSSTPHLNNGEFADMPDFTKILGAAKITGKTKNGWSVGILESVTARETADIQGNGIERSEAVEPFTNYLVARFQKDFNKGNTYFGGIMTAVNRKIDDSQLNFLHKSAYSGGIDFVHKWNNKMWGAEGGFYFSQVNGSKEAIARTQTSWIRNFQRPDADYLDFDPNRTSLAGNGGKLSLSKMGGKLKFGSQFSWKTPGLELNDVGFGQQIDQIMQVLWTYYQIYEPFSIFRNISFNLSEYAQWDFGGNRNNLGGTLTSNAQFTNYWNTFINVTVSGEMLSNSALRGGPALKIPGYRNIMLNLMTNPQNKTTFQVNGGTSFTEAKDFSNWYNLSLNFGYRPFKTLRLDITPGKYLSESELQYVTQSYYNNDIRYVFAHINQNTLNVSFRLNYNITPNLSIQYWGQPFFATGEYNNFKYITDSKAEELEDRYRFYTEDQISYNSSLSVYSIDDNMDGVTDYSFRKPDFNVKTFLSNLVIRWEYQPGSTVYLVWSQNRSGYANDGSFEASRDIESLFDESANNIFLIKFSYRIGR